VVRENYLPLPLRDYDGGVEEPIDYILEPDPLTLVRNLLPQVLLLKLYTVLLDANAAEHAARTLAMQIATDNANDLIGELTLAYNKGRQQEITAEILDLVGGTMA
jgi:F-type H+-transporting ATPase subunit gamma